MTTAAFLQAEKTLVISSQKDQTHLAKQHQLFSCTSPGVFWPFPTYCRILGWLLLPILFVPLFHPHPQLALLQVSKASPTFHISNFTSLKLLWCFLAPALSTQTEIPPCKAALPFCSLAPLTKSQKVLNTPVLGMPDIKFSSLFFPSPPPCNEDIPRVIVSPLMGSDSQVWFLFYLHPPFVALLLFKWGTETPLGLNDPHCAENKDKAALEVPNSAFGRQSLPGKHQSYSPSQHPQWRFIPFLTSALTEHNSCPVFILLSLQRTHFLAQNSPSETQITIGG